MYPFSDFNLPQRIDQYHLDFHMEHFWVFFLLLLFSTSFRLGEEHYLGCWLGPKKITLSDVSFCSPPVYKDPT